MSIAVSETVVFAKDWEKREKVVLRSHFGGAVTVELDIRTLEDLGLRLHYKFDRHREKSFLNVVNGHKHKIYKQKNCEE
jgi:hypothetical protein